MPKLSETMERWQLISLAEPAGWTERGGSKAICKLHGVHRQERARMEKLLKYLRVTCNTKVADSYI
jgi:hypothetical protein